MRSGLIIRSLLFLVLSHVLIVSLLYAFPELPQLIQANLPLSFNNTLAVAMTAVAGRAPVFLTRSFTFSNPNYRAGKSQRKDTALAYRVFLDLHQNIRRSIDPYKVSSSRSYSSTSRTASAATSSAIPHISLHIAASSSGKGRKFKPELCTHDYEPSKTDGHFGLQKGRYIEEKRKGRPDSGQDAYFAARVGPAHTSTAFAIADGVGGWTGHGIDPADFSHGLCSHMANISLRWPEGRLGPKELLNMGYEATSTDPEIEGGGTTACVAVADESGRMRIANLGDSGWLQLRLGTVHHYSNPQTHAFNTPFQMSLTPPDVLRQARIFGGTPLNDAPDRADLADHMLRHGDILVLATDGVWDNLDAQDVLKIVSSIMRETGAWKLDPSEGYQVADTIGEMVEKNRVHQPRIRGTLQAVLAAGIAGEAKTASLNQRRDGPFAKAIQKEYPYESFNGGKVDDIAVLVVVPIDSRQKEQALRAKL